MCLKATCTTCHKSSWWGCGNHIQAVMDPVPEDQRCTCGPQIEKDGKGYPKKADKAD